MACNMKKIIHHLLMRKLNLRFGFIVVMIIGFAKVNAQQTSTIINIDSTHQFIRGFGAANILPWRPDMTEEEVYKGFGTDDGQIGFSILRLRVPSDLNESSMSMQVPTAKLAQSLGAIVIASPWSPPADMKTNNNTIGGELRESYYDDFATHLKEFADYMEDNGAPLYAISVQNEPDIEVSYESCDWNPEQMVKFIAENGKDIGIPIIAPESFQFRRPISDAILNDSVACANVSIIGGHIYGGGLSEYPLVHEKGKELWMTEHLDTDTSWAAVLATGIEIHSCMVANMNAYIWWYIVRFYGPILENGEVSKRGYVMSQFSRFVRPGYSRIYCNPFPQRNLSLTAYKDSSSSKVVIVAINNSTSNLTQSFTLQNADAEKFTSYVTTETKNCVQESDISVNGGNFTITLEPSSITTFVSTDFAVSVENETTIRKQYNLLQNYPNPFNPITNIEYSVPQSSYVSLKVYNFLGEEVATLFEGSREAGNYVVQFDGADLASGLYLYQFKANDFNETKKLILLK